MVSKQKIWNNVEEAYVQKWTVKATTKEEERYYLLLLYIFFFCYKIRILDCSKIFVISIFFFFIRCYTFYILKYCVNKINTTTYIQQTNELVEMKMPHPNFAERANN